MIGLCYDSRGGIVAGDWIAFSSQLKASNPQEANVGGDGESEIHDNIVGGENMIVYGNNDNIEQEQKTIEASEGNLQVVSLHSIPDEA